MEDLAPLPKINKIPFIVVDVLLVAAALLIRFSVETPLSPFNGFLIAACIALGSFVLCLPYLVEHRTMAKLQEYDLSQANTENARRIEAALLGIQEVGEAVVQQADRGAETAATFGELLQRLESRIGEIRKPQTTGIDPEQLKEALREQFAAVQEEFVRAVTEQTALSSDAQHQKLNSALNKLQGLPMQVTLLGDLATRYQGLAALIQDTAAQLIESTPPPPAKLHAKEAPPVDSVDGVIESEVEENVAAEVVTTASIDDYDEMDRRFEEEMAREATEKVAAEDSVEEAAYEIELEDIAAEEVVAEAEADIESAEIALEDLEEDGAHIARAEVEDEDAGESLEDLAEEALEDDGSTDEPANAEPEFLTDEDLAEDEPTAVDEALEDEEEDDFDIALSSELDDDSAEESEEAEPAEVVAEAELSDEDAGEDESGMGFEDWDDFGEIASEEAVAEADAVAPVEEPEQAELMADIPSKPKTKPTKAKGVTTLIAQVLIGIGNKPYVRGVGPGLSEDEGVPMEFLEIGKWQWVAPESDEPVIVQIYKNDEIAAEGDPVEIPAGQRRSVAPKFPH